MKENPLVSIITTYYNSVTLGDFVKSSMDCLLNQTYQNIEFICVNDGSVDNTLMELEEFASKDSRIKIYTKVNQKYAQYSKAYGQERAKGEFIFLFDHDDFVENNAIEKALLTFEKNPELDIVSFLVETQTTTGLRKDFLNLNTPIKKISDFEPFQISGAEAIKQTVGKYDLHIRGVFRSPIFKSFSFEFTEPLLNADEIVERLIFENARYIGSCDALYIHYIHPDSSAKAPSIKKIDIIRTDVLLRNIFQEKNIYNERKKIFEHTAYRNFINALKTFHHFEKEMDISQKKLQLHRLKESFNHLDKPLIIGDFTGLTKLYHQILLSHFTICFSYYQFKK